MSTIRTEEQKAEMLRMRTEGKSDREIGEHFGIKRDIVRKALARMAAPRPALVVAPSEQKREEPAAKPKTQPEPKAPAAKTDRLARLHDEFDTKAPGRAASRPQWAGRPPLRVTPKDFPHG